MRILFLILGFILLFVLGISLTDSNIQSKPNNDLIKAEIDSLPNDTTTKMEFVRVLGLPSNFDTVPGGRYVFRTNQPSLKQLKLILQTYPINTVIRMNAEEGTGVSIESEKKIVESLGKKFVWVNAHEGYQKGKGYIGSLNKIQPLLDSGNVIIHCAAGADRTGYQVANYIQRNLNWSRQELWYYTIKYNSWEKYIPNGQQGYIKYMEAFYPYDKWKLEIGK